MSTLGTNKAKSAMASTLGGLIGGAIAFLVLLFVGFDIIGAAGVGVIVFVITLLNTRKYYR